MKRDSLYGEPVLWSGRPKDISTPPMYRVASAVCGVSSAITTAAAVVLSTALDARPDGLLAFAAWMATLAVAFYFGPRWWRSELLFTLTDQHIVMRRGRLRRSIDRREISYARIHWNPKLPGIGDLEIVRAVPTGALRRRLTIRLPGLVAPDRVWAIMRGSRPPRPRATATASSPSASTTASASSGPRTRSSACATGSRARFDRWAPSRSPSPSAAPGPSCRCTR